MAPLSNRDLPEVVSELIIEMHEVRSEPNALNSRIDQLGDRVDRLERTVGKGFQGLQQEFRDEMCQHTNRLIEAFGRSREPLVNKPLVNQVLTHDARLNRLETPQS